MGHVRPAAWWGLLVLWLPSAHAQVCLDPRAVAEIDRCEDAQATRELSRPGGSTPLTHGIETPARPPTPEGIPLEPPRPPGDRARQGAATLELLEEELRVLARLVINTRRADDQHAQVCERLAVTSDELAQLLETNARALDQPIFAAQQAHRDPEHARLLNTQRDHERRSREALEEAIRARATLIEAHAQFRAMDRVLFALAGDLERLERADQARPVYYRLLREHPQSVYVPYAYLAFAEHYFGLGELDHAAAFYERVLQLPADRNALYGYALYKLAWVRFNQERFTDSLDAFVRVIEHVEQHPDEPGAVALGRQARREIVQPYARTGRASQALAFFRRTAGNDPDALQMLGALATLYFDAGRWVETIQVHHELMAQSPRDPHLCEWQARVLDATIASRPKAEQVREVRRMLEVRQTIDASARAACEDEAATTTLLLASAWHREAVGTDDQPGTRDRRTMELASELYGLMRSELPPVDRLALSRIDSRDRPTPQSLAYFHGELLYDMERYHDCASAYDDAAALAPRGPFAADAAYGAVLCYDRVLAATPPPARAPGQNDRAPRPFAPEQQRMLDGFRRFACLAPDHEEIAIAQFRRGLLYFEHNRFDEASVLFRRVALDHPESNVAEPAANLHLESLNVLLEGGRAPCLATLAGDLGPVQSALCTTEEAREAHSDVCTRIGPLHCDIDARQAERLHREGRYLEAARAYLALVTNERACPHADLYLQNAAIAFEAGRYLGRSIRVRTALLARFPESEHAATARWQLAGNYHALAFYDQAAEHYERFAADHPNLDADECAADDEECPNPARALQHAVVFRAGLGQDDRAFADAALFARGFGRRHPAQAAEIAFALAGLHERGERWSELRAHLRELLRVHGDALSLDQTLRAQAGIARSWLRDGRPDEAEHQWRAVVDRWAQTGDAALREAYPNEEDRTGHAFFAHDAVAEATFQLAERRRAAFEAIAFPRFSGSASLARVNRWATEDLMPWMERKRVALLSALELYDRVAALGIPRWNIAAAQQIGEMFLAVVDRVRESPIPDAIRNDPEAFDLYIAEYERAIAPYEETAIARFAGCLAIATRARWFDVRSAACEQQLNRLDASRFPVQAELRGPSTWTPTALAQPGPPPTLEAQQPETLGDSG